MARISAQQAGGINRVAFLDMIAFGEIGPAILKASDDGYNVLVGSTPKNILTFPSYAKHPEVYNPKMNSTAAGRYQELAANYLAYSTLLKLPDFSPISQDLIALQQLKEFHALPAIDAGRIASAISLVGNLWASMPGSKWGQRTAASPSVGDFIQAYKTAGGVVA